MRKGVKMNLTVECNKHSIGLSAKIVIDENGKQEPVFFISDIKNIYPKAKNVILAKRNGRDVVWNSNGQFFAYYFRSSELHGFGFDATARELVNELTRVAIYANRSNEITNIRNDILI